MFDNLSSNSNSCLSWGIVMCRVPGKNGEQQPILSSRIHKSSNILNMSASISAMCHLEQRAR